MAELLTAQALFTLFMFILLQAVFGFDNLFKDLGAIVLTKMVPKLIPGAHKMTPRTFKLSQGSPQSAPGAPQEHPRSTP